jgi:hypothetical protein
VIQYLDAEYISSFEKALGYHDIVCTGNKYATGMVVSYHNSCRPLSQWVRKDLPRTVENGTVNLSMIEN